MSWFFENLWRHFTLDPSGAATMILLGGTLDVVTLVLHLARERKGRGASGIPAIPWFLYCWAAVFARDPTPFDGHPALLFRFLSVGVMTGLHVCCQWLLPAMYGAWFNGRSALHRAVLCGDERRVQRILARGADPSSRDNRGRTPLHLAARKGHRSIAERLLVGGADARSIADERYSPLFWAVTGDHKEVVETLLSHCVDPLVDEMSLRAAVEGGHRDILELMLPTGVNIENELGNKLATCAVGAGQLEIARDLMARGAKMDVNARSDFQGNTLLYSMIGHGWNRHKAETAEFLISLGADVNARNSLGLSPLRFALTLKAKDVADVLRRHGAQE